MYWTRFITGSRFKHKLKVKLISVIFISFIFNLSLTCSSYFQRKVYSLYALPTLTELNTYLLRVKSLREDLKLRPCRFDRAVALLIQQGRGLRFSCCFVNFTRTTESCLNKRSSSIALTRLESKNRIPVIN